VVVTLGVTGGVFDLDADKVFDALYDGLIRWLRGLNASPRKEVPCVATRSNLLTCVTVLYVNTW
jgi:hypothetical protein